MDDEDNNYDCKFNPNFIIIQLELHSNFYYSPSFSYRTDKDEIVCDIFRNNSPAFWQTDLTEDIYDDDDDDDDDDDPWVLTDSKQFINKIPLSTFLNLSYSTFCHIHIYIHTGTRFVNKRQGGGIDCKNCRLYHNQQMSRIILSIWICFLIILFHCFFSFLFSL